jgi:ribose/xylose/arabinose/galactoside ABC-type transport system permease subunit
MAEPRSGILRATTGAREVTLRAATAAGGRVGALAILLLLVVAFFIATPDFLTTDNTVNVLRQYSVPAILAIGQTLVIISGGIDLSVAATAALSGSLMGVAFAHWGWPEPLALLLGLAAGFAVGAFNGYVITRWRVPDFVATLGTFAAARGVALLITDGLPVPDYRQAVEGRTIPGSVATLGAESFLSIPLIALVAAGCAVFAWFVLARTKQGRSAYAVGGNREAARVSGIRVDRVKMRVYILSGLLAAVAGFMLTGRQASANALMGEGMELQSIAAVVVGGANLFGGEGGVGGTMIGVLIIGVLDNGLDILGVEEFWQRVVNGLIIVAVVALDQWRRRVALLKSRDRPPGQGSGAERGAAPREPSGVDGGADDRGDDRADGPPGSPVGRVNESTTDK